MTVLVERKLILFGSIALSVAGIAAGFLGGNLLQGMTAQKQYEDGRTTTTAVTKVIRSYNGITGNDERITTTTTVNKETHSHDGIPEHTHIQTIIVTRNETTPDGVFFDFAAQNITVASPPKTLTAPVSPTPVAPVVPTTPAAPAPTTPVVPAAPAATPVPPPSPPVAPVAPAIPAPPEIPGLGIPPGYVSE